MHLIPGKLYESIWPSTPIVLNANNEQTEIRTNVEVGDVLMFLYTKTIIPLTPTLPPFEAHIFLHKNSRVFAGANDDFTFIKALNE